MRFTRNNKPGHPMKGTRTIARLPWAVLLALLFASGCERSASSQSIGAADKPAAMEDAAEEEPQFSLPSNYVEVVARLHECRDAIRDAIKSGDFEKAHHPLDEIDWLLNRLPELARASGVPRRDWEQVVVAGDDLGESLGEIHADIDAGRTPDFASRAATIEDALTRLQDVHQEK
jgi:hypothetical protein